MHASTITLSPRVDHKLACCTPTDETQSQWGKCMPAGARKLVVDWLLMMPPKLLSLSYTIYSYSYIKNPI